MQKELFLRMAGIEAEWPDILRDLDALTEVEIENGARRFLVRSRAKGSTVAILRCVGAADHHTTHRRRACKREGNPHIGLTTDIGSGIANPAKRSATRQKSPATH